MISALDRKLLRDLWSMKGQVLAIAFVIAGGVATFIMSLSVLDSLQTTQAAYYRDYRFADVFASLKRAPESLRSRIEEIPGVQIVETRVNSAANLDLENFHEPVKAVIVSVPDESQPRLNQLFLRRGRMVDGQRDNEVVVSEAFADAHTLQPGQHLSATINGRRRRLEIVGIALAPDFIYQLPPGSIIPDFKRFAILWMARTPLESAQDMKGAFNDLSLSLTRDGSEEDVIDRLDELLEPYGGLGAYGRKDQLSHRYLSEEFKQLGQMAKVFPVIFLGVAAFLLNVVVSRLIAAQREQLAILKAFGYSNVEVAMHYLKMIAVVVVVGVVLGIGFGIWLGRGMSSMYMDFYKFPFLIYHLRPAVAILAVAISAAAAFAGTLYSVIRATGIAPAEAMLPPRPAKYRQSLVERIGLRRWLAQPTRMIVRNIERRPVKALLTVLGIAFSCAILVSGSFFGDSVNYLVDIQFKMAQREDVAVTFIEATSRRAVYSMLGIDGVEYVEPFRSVPVRLRFEHHEYRTSIHGFPTGASLRRLLDLKLHVVDLPPYGLVLTDHLATTLGVVPGDRLTVEVLEGNRAVRQVPVVGLVKEYVGVSAYMQLEALNRLMREGEAISGVYVMADERKQPRLYAELDEMPRVAGSSVRKRALESFYETMAQQVLTFAFFNTILAGVIAIGVVYNSMRIAFAERARELGSLRVLGFTRGEISYILLGEMGILTLVGVPLGFLVGRGLGAVMISGVQTDLFRIPLIISPSTYGFAATVVLVASAFSGWLIKRKLDRLDLVAVLKTKE